MKAAIIKEKNTPIVIEQIANPEPSLKEVVVDVQFAGLNHRDVWILKGQYAGIQYPMVVGSDLAGTYLGKKVIVNPAFNWGTSRLTNPIILKFLDYPSTEHLPKR